MFVTTCSVRESTRRTRVQQKQVIFFPPLSTQTTIREAFGLPVLLGEYATRASVVNTSVTFVNTDESWEKHVQTNGFLPTPRQFSKQRMAQRRVNELHRGGG